MSWASSAPPTGPRRSEEHTSELQSHVKLVCRLLLEKKKVANQQPDAPRKQTFCVIPEGLGDVQGWGESFDVRFLSSEAASAEIYTLSLHDALPIFARDLVVALDTVKKHVTHVLGKLGATNRTE